MKQIPNIFTLLNLCMGCVAILLTLQTGESIARIQGEEWTIYLPEKMSWAALFIGIAAVVDFLDGFIARLFKATSEMGKQLDSLSDLVSFGVAPGFIIYQLLRLSFAAEPSGLNTPLLFLLPCLLIPFAAAWRLARLNLDTIHKNNFEGLPTPAAGLLIASFPIILLYNPLNIQMLLMNKWVLYLICLLVPYLMISRLPLLTMKFSTMAFKQNKARYILIGLSACYIGVLGWLSVPAIFITYILVSLLLKNQTT